MVDVPVADLDAAQTAAAVGAGVQTVIAAKCDELVYAAHWAVLHSPDRLPRAGSAPVALLGERAMVYGGPGTPEVAEFAAATFAPEAALSVGQAKALIADALDVQYRFPQLWQLVVQHRVRPKLVRQVAFRTRDLDAGQCGAIDAVLVDKITGLVPGRRFTTVLNAEILRVDADRIRAEAERALTERFVAVGRPDEYGNATVTIRMTGPAAHRLDAILDQLAAILADSEEPIAGVPVREARTRQEWRSVAAEVLTIPGLALKILIEHGQPDLFTDYAHLLIEPDPAPRSEPGADQHAGSGRRPGPAASSQPPAAASGHPDPSTKAAADSTGRSHPVNEPDPEPTTDLDGDAAPGPEPTTDADPATDPDPDLEVRKAQALKTMIKHLDVDRLLPRATLYIHLGPDTLAGPGQAPIARVEDIGPTLLDQVRHWLSHHRVRVQPVLDTGDLPVVDAYEIPTVLREGILARSPASQFPYSNSLGRQLDLDHSPSYIHGPTGPPGQTGAHSLGPLNRPEHRYRTHGPIQLRQPDPDTRVWRTPYGRVLVVNPTGTHDLGTGTLAETVWNALTEPAPDPVGSPLETVLRHILDRRTHQPDPPTPTLN